MKKARAEFKKGIHGTDPILTDGIPQVAFVGRSNVGKSSLISTLIGVPGLVRISDTPGRTTEINFFLVDGAYYLVDLPGYGYARLSEKERAHIKDLIIWYVSASGARPKLFVVVLDAKVGLTDFDKDMIYMLESEGHPYVIAANKADKLNQKESAQVVFDIHKETPHARVILTWHDARGVTELKTLLD